MIEAIFTQTLATGFDWYAWVILPLIVFFARVCDVTLGTIRIIFISRGLRKFAPFLGFFEVLIWIVVIGQLVQHLTSITAYIGYAAGFATGNFVGMWLEDRLALGTYMLRVMISGESQSLVNAIHEAGFGVTQVEATGSIGPVKMIYIVVKRKDVDQVMAIIHGQTPQAFITAEEIRSAEKGIFPTRERKIKGQMFSRNGK
ncbi:MAG: DUF2179 domain-containing protein [Anaerolineaceae bacterium]|nr:DUF2179 domain-containing protein [Anaerolineaceae bacterium]